MFLYIFSTEDIFLIKKQFVIKDVLRMDYI